MHALVELAKQRWLDTNHRLERCKQQFISNLSAAFPKGHYENWESCRALFPHAKAEAIRGILIRKVRNKTLGREHEDTLQSIEMTANLCSLGGRYKEAEAPGTKVMETRKTKLGDEYPSTLASMANLACTWKYQGRDAEAIALVRECVQSRYRKLGANHPDFISSSATLAEREGKQMSAILLADASIDEHDE
ncbi:hypothetical protein BS50DRAFT_662971 [Corynespora cassiicola Philippines]|uniref:Kinesin light chain n=1 Tax=Corynespora cassiicola Philippines TaxID=1448308 RepID=A0A2T2N0F2_CORCC|nr:hypothetical protein BS50DRAFT_662971 [Corynespora cassiicola Philippines]